MKHIKKWGLGLVLALTLSASHGAEIEFDVTGTYFSPKTATTTAANIRFGGDYSKPTKVIITNKSTTSAEIIWITEYPNTAAVNRGRPVYPGVTYIWTKRDQGYNTFDGISYIAESGTPTIAFGAEGD